MSDEQNPVAWLDEENVIVGNNESGTARPLYLHPSPEQANDFKPDYDAIQELLEEISRLWDIIIDLEEQLREFHEQR